MTSTIITTHYRYKRPPRKRKAVALEASAIVTAKSSRRPVSGKTAAEVVPPAPKEGQCSRAHRASAETDRVLGEAHKLFDEISNMLTEMRRELLASVRQR